MTVRHPVSILVFLLLAALSADAGDVSGRIIVTKRLTRRRVEPVASAYHRGAALASSTAESSFSTQELERVAVYVEGVPDPLRSPMTVDLGQQNRRFTPEVVVVPVGSSVSFPNYDPLFHNVFSLAKAKSFDLGNYPKGQTRTVTFPKTGIVPVFCHLHPNMSAVIVVTPSRHAAKPDPNTGAFRLHGVPPGRHTVAAWHRSAGYFRKEVDVPASGEVQLDFTIPVDPSEGPK